MLVNLSSPPSCPMCRGMQALLELRECVKERTAYAEEVGAAHGQAVVTCNIQVPLLMPCTRATSQAACSCRHTAWAL